MSPDDYGDVARIFAQGIESKNATFETRPETWEQWDASHLRTCRLVARDDDGIVGWAALTPTSSRHVYRGVAEVSVYVDERARGRGVGDALMRALVDSAERGGLWTLQSGIFPENSASLALHVKHGFRVVGTRERIGEMDGAWRDVVLLERRSAK